MLAAALAALAVVTLTLYSPALSNPFITYDDPDYVTQNPHVQSGLSWPFVKWAFVTTSAGNWHPLTWLSHGLDVQLFGLNAGGHHAMSVLLHAANGILLFLFLARSTRAVGRSFVAAALFAVHPINVESVAWVAERKNVLCTFFFLLTLIAYCRYAHGPTVYRYVLTVLLFMAALASKPMAVTLPCVLVLLDFWPLRRVRLFSPDGTQVGSRRDLMALIVEKLPFFMLSAVSGVVTLIAQRSAGAMVTTEALPLNLRLGNAVCAYVLYLWRAIWPRGYAPFYPGVSLMAWRIVGASMLLCAASVFAYRQRMKRPYLLFGWLWFLGTLLPVIGLIQVGSQSMADRYAYIPLVGIFVAVTWAAAELVDSTAMSFRLPVVAATFLTVIFCAATWRQIRYWRSDYDLWTHALRVTRNNVVAEDILGLQLLASGQYDNALQHFRSAERIAPKDPTSHLNIGVILQQQGDVQGAISEYETSTSLTNEPATLAIAYDGLGTIYQSIGDHSKARANLVRALKANPRQTDALFKLGQLESGQAPNSHQSDQ